MSKPITVLERKPVETELVEREYTYEELLELFPDGGESIVNPLVRRCQEYEAEIEQLRGLAIRAWNSFRSGLTAGGGCDCGLTDADILELVRLAKAGATKL